MSLISLEIGGQFMVEFVTDPGRRHWTSTQVCFQAPEAHDCLLEGPRGEGPEAEGHGLSKVKRKETSPCPE